MKKISSSDKEAINHIWSLFAAAPSDQRILILKGILSTCCMPQLSFIFNATKPLLRIDFVAILPKEINLTIFSYLDAKTLCHAAQVSQTWKEIANDDLLWHQMCEQHIDKKCTKCGWGLPLLDKKRLKRQNTKNQPAFKKRAINQQVQSIIKRPWKDVYSERMMVERNWRNNQYNLLRLQGHTDGVMCIQFCEISKLVITGSLDKTIRVWHLETGELIRTLIAHSGGIRSLQFDDAKLVTGSMDKTLRVWNHHTGQCIRTLEGHSGPVLDLHFDERMMASGSTDHTVRVWNFDIGECCTLLGHTDWVNSVRLCKEGKMLISSSDDTTIRLWDLSTRSCTKIFQGHVGQVQVALPSLDGFRHCIVNNLSESSHTSSTSSILQPLTNSSIIISSSLDNTIKLWDIQTGQCIRTLFGHIQGVWALDFDKLHIISGSHDKTIRVWDTASGQCLYALEGHYESVRTVRLSDTRIVSGSDDGEVIIWDFGRVIK